MSLFFTSPFPVRLRPAMAYDYVIAYSNDKKRECECETLIDVRVYAPTRRDTEKPAFFFFLRVQAFELCVGQWMHMSSYLGHFSYMQWRHVHWYDTDSKRLSLKVIFSHQRVRERAQRDVAARYRRSG
jgi:hypothetical protein